MPLDAIRPAPRTPRLSWQDARRRLAHERRSRLVQIGAAEDGAAAPERAADGPRAARLTALREVLAEIDAAVRRLDEGGYGLCEDCTRAIPAERLEILPYVRRCVSCERRRA